MKEEYAAGLQVGGGEEIRLNADIGMSGQHAGKLLQEAGEQSGMGGVMQADAEERLQANQMNMAEEETAGLIGAEQCTDETHELPVGETLTGGSDSHRETATDSPDAKNNGKPLIPGEGQVHRGDEEKDRQ